MKKFIDKIIKEEYNKFLIKEFMQSSFNIEDFIKLYNEDSDHGIDYCFYHLGEPIGEGSSRVVFEIDDYSVLKIALNTDEIWQNENEIRIYSKLKDSPLVPKIYGYDKEHYTWVWSERVLPCTCEDFQKILGIPYSDYVDDKNDKTVGFDDYKSPNDLQLQNGATFDDFIMWISVGSDPNDELSNIYREWLKHPWFEELTTLIDKGVNIYDVNIANMGIAMRGGKPTIIILDTGFIS